MIRDLLPAAGSILFSTAVLCTGIGMAAQSREQPPAVTFTSDIAPVLAARCQPCHFKGGTVFGKLPFDRYKTVATIASRLNTRLKGKDAALVTRWIDAGSPE
jgi:hypothetical protein